MCQTLFKALKTETQVRLSPWHSVWHMLGFSEIFMKLNDKKRMNDVHGSSSFYYLNSSEAHIYVFNLFSTVTKAIQ